MNWIPVNNTTFDPETLPQRIRGSRFSKDVFVWIWRIKKPDICAYDYDKDLWVDKPGNYYEWDSISHYSEIISPEVLVN